MMTQQDCFATIYFETMKPGGFMWKLRENEVDWEGANRLLQSIQRLQLFWRSQADCDRLTVACLFEVPWEISNTVEHYGENDEELGQRVSMLADELRDAILDLLWDGLESAYEHLS